MAKIMEQAGGAGQALLFESEPATTPRAPAADTSAGTVEPTLAAE